MNSFSDQLPDSVRALLRAATWHRRLLASVCVAAAIAFGLSALAPKPATVVHVLAAARAVPAGSVLTAADVHAIGLPPAVVPVGALRAGTDVEGRVVAAALARNEPLTDVRLVGASMFAAVSAGLVAAPVRIADPAVARLLQPGDVVDVLAASDRASATTVVAAGVRVLAVPAPGDTGGGLDDGALVVLATSPSTAAGLAHAAVATRLSVVIHGSQ
ncbi:MAG: RcpC/CpaB family pilus assembly protein [Actinomycetes bacterium]